jgi:predicted CXXCH cytochrome family protein
VGCHHFESGLSHPVDVVPKKPVPNQLPLDGGKVTCLTCHDGSAAIGHEDRPIRGKSFLRSADTLGTLCDACHADSKANGHARGFRWAHPSAPKNARRALPNNLDDESSACMSCHDGTVAEDPESGGRKGHGVTGPSDHPVGTPFAVRHVPGDDKPALVPVARLDKMLRLYNGNVGCGTCHSVYSSERENLLVVNNRASRLCLSCHIE